MLEKKCKLCGSTPSIQETEHFYFALHTFQEQIKRAVEIAKQTGTWRDNAIQLTERYVKEGLLDRAVSRDLPIGVPIPVEGYEDKKIYVWIEAVTGYYSASKHWAEETGKDDREFWDGKRKHIMCTERIIFRFIPSFGQRLTWNRRRGNSSSYRFE